MYPIAVGLIKPNNIARKDRMLSIDGEELENVVAMAGGPPKEDAGPTAVVNLGTCLLGVVCW